MLQRSILYLLPAAVVSALGLAAVIVAARGRPSHPFLSAMMLGGEPLALNGRGTCLRAGRRQCEAALYTAAPVKSAEELFAAPGGKRLHAVTLRAIDAHTVSLMLLHYAARNNSFEDILQHCDTLGHLGAWLRSRGRLERGDSLQVDFLPGLGTRVSFNGEPSDGGFADPDFFAFISRSWLGERPLDPALKTALFN